MILVRFSVNQSNMFFEFKGNEEATKQTVRHLNQDNRIKKVWLTYHTENEFEALKINFRNEAVKRLSKEELQKQFPEIVQQIKKEKEEAELLYYSYDF